MLSLSDMSQYIVSARKYRPESFETLIGQDNIAQTLKNSILRGKLAHAYLFCGPRGVGKTTTARIFAKMINCSNPSADMEPCGRCESCLSFAEGRSYCIHELDAASNNGVEDIKNLMDQVRIPPQVGKYSVYIIDEVHMLSQAAFNAFLKTLEEPPAHAIFILATTEKHKILPTILSRCQTYDFNRITVENIVRNLKMVAEKEDVKIDEESLHVIAQKADGAMRDALTVFDQTVAFCGTDIHYQDVIRNLNVLDYEYSFSLVESFLTGNYAHALLAFDEILAKGFNALHFVSALSSHFRDLIVAKNGGMDALLELPESLKKRYKEQADKCTLRFLYEALGLTTQCEAQYRASVNQRLHIEFTLLRLSALSGNMMPAQQTMTAAPAQSIPAHQTMEATSLQQTVATAPVQTISVQPAVTAAPLQQTVTQTKVQTPAQHSENQSAEARKTETKAISEPLSTETKMKDQVHIAETPATAASETGTNAQGRRNRTAATKTGLSIAEIVKPKEEVSIEVQKTAVPVENLEKKPDENIIREQWKVLANSYVSKPRLHNMLLNSELKIKIGEKDIVITFMASNQGQKEWVESKMMRSLEGTIRQLLLYKHVFLHIDVMPIEIAETDVTVFTAQQKAEKLAGENAGVQGIIKDLNLEIK